MNSNGPTQVYPNPPRGWRVLKFGGTSVATPARWEAIAKILRERLAEGRRPLVVCSALSGVSNELERLLICAMSGTPDEAALDSLASRHEELASGLGVTLPAPAREELEALRSRLADISRNQAATPRLKARVLASGELLSTRIGAAWLTRQGLPTHWLDARELLRAEPEPEREHHQYLSADCGHAPDAALERRLADVTEPVALTQGFLASAPDGETALLGRGGSDTSATILGAKIGAERVEIWTDVAGLYTADPRIVPEARKISRLGYEEASELATRGAKVLHPRSLAPARDSGTPIHILNTADPSEPGTVIDKLAGSVAPSAHALSSRKGMAVVDMDVEGSWPQVGVIADLSACFARLGLPIDAIASSQTRVTVALDPAAHPLDDELVQTLLQNLEPLCHPTMLSPVTSISVVGTHLRCVLHDLPSLFRILEREEIYLISHAAHDRSLTFVVDESASEQILRELHRDLVRVRES